MPSFVLRSFTRRTSLRLVGTVVCLILGTGLLGGAAAGAWLNGDAEPSAAEVAYDAGRELWRNLPVDRLFPPEVSAEEAGPGGADRRWVRVAVAPDSACGDDAFDPLLARVLGAVGCHRLVRATYVDETESSVITVGLMFAQGDAGDMAALHDRFADEDLGTRADLMPRTYPAPGTPAEDFGDAQRASWTIRVLEELPVVVYSVSGFADGRTVEDPQPAAEATAEGEEGTVALSGLGHDARGLAERIGDGLRAAARERRQDR
ncbi:hypothetical protein D7294_25330 [Streptomyces hoynatensis]|uniref:Uncharacterized protein n=1 Tax=Streptomyces hoynatensis TaxID=1141874 RepID=A0A3A9YSE2_9ACTN|nr:hypothetical protein D7294_25330 [Streptomyces hoynatensis]